MVTHTVKGNPWAICRAAQKRFGWSDAKMERCVKLVKKVSEFKEPDHEQMLSDIKENLDWLKNQGYDQMYASFEGELIVLRSSLAETILRLQKMRFGEPFSECPTIPEAKEFIARSQEFLDSKHPTDTNLAEVASIGYNYTFHTHPRGTPAPSEPDVQTTRALHKEFLCLGLVPSKTISCFNSETLEKVCEHPA